MFALVPCVLFFEALGHEIVRLFTVASLKPQVHWSSAAGRVALSAHASLHTGLCRLPCTSARRCVSAFVALRMASVCVNWAFAVFSD